MHRKSADTNLAEIHEEMSELFDKQVNVKEILKKTSGVHKNSHKPMKKVCDEIKKKNDCHIKIFVVTGRHL